MEKALYFFHLGHLTNEGVGINLWDAGLDRVAFLGTMPAALPGTPQSQPVEEAWVAEMSLWALFGSRGA